MIKKALVTGANGFVGSYVTKELVNQGTEVLAVVRDYDSDVRTISTLPGVTIVVCDMSNYSRLEEIISDRNIDVVFHFAWLGSAGTLRNDSHVQCLNIENTCTLIKACQKMSIPRFVFASSIMEYELLEHEKRGKIDRCTLYSAAKLATHHMSGIVAASCGIEYIRTVISNVYGPEEKSPRLVNSSIRKMLKGEHCAFSDGEQMYDFIYCTDAAKAFVAVGDRGISGKKYYIGSRAPRQLKSFLTEMRDCVDPDIEIGLGELSSAAMFVDYNTIDLNAVFNDTGVTPEVSFREGIHKTTEWIKGHLDDGVCF